MASTVVHFGWSVVSLHWGSGQKLGSSSSQWQCWWQCWVSCCLFTHGKQFQNRIQNVHLQSSVISWQALLGHRSTSWKSGTLEFMVVAPVKSVSTPITADTSRTPILDICVLSWNFKLLSSSWFVSLSPEESLLTPQSYRVFWGTSRFNYKRAKTNTVFLQNSHFSWKEISCVWPFGKGNSQLIF